MTETATSRPVSVADLMKVITGCARELRLLKIETRRTQASLLLRRDSAMRAASRSGLPLHDLIDITGLSASRVRQILGQGA